MSCWLSTVFLAMVYQRLALLDVVELVTSTRLEKWAPTEILQSPAKGNSEFCTSCCRNNPMHQLGCGKQLEKQLCGKGPGGTGWQQVGLCRVQKAVASWAALRALPAGQGAMILLCSALPRPHLGCWVQHLAPLSKKSWTHWSECSEGLCR